MIAAYFAGLRQPSEQRAAIVLDERSLAMHEAPRAYDFTAEHFHDRLMAETHPEHRQLPRKRADHLHRHARIVGRAWTGRYAKVRGGKKLRLAHADRIVAIHMHVRP